MARGTSVRRVGLTVLLTSSAILVGLLFVGAEAGRSVTNDCRRAWVVDRRPAGKINALAVDARGVWAAGFGSGRALRFDGRSWSSLPISGVTSVADLAIGDGSVWAVAGASVYRRRGVRWQRLVVPGLPRARKGLSFSTIDVSGRDLWVGGAYDNSTYTKNGDWGSRWLTARLHDRRWRAYPAPRATDASLSAIDIVDARDGWAVGGQGPTMASAQEVMLHWNGSEWIDMSRYDYVLRLNDVLALSRNDAWAAGETNLDAFSRYGRRPAIEHWNGKQWARVKTPGWNRPSPRLTSLAAFGPHDVWAGGQREDGAPTLLHWNGGRWSEALPPPVGSGILDLAAARDGTLWAAGDHFIAHSRCT